MALPLAPYACDQCRSRKVACSRLQSGCHRCQKEDLPCVYSRSGVIRRCRKRKIEAPVERQHDFGDDARQNPGPSSANFNSLQSQLTLDIESTRERLSAVYSSQDNLLGALSSLSESYVTFWQEDSRLREGAKNFFLFEDRTPMWVDAFVATLERGRPLLHAAPGEVIEHLRAARPNEVQDRAWLVMYYSIVLGLVSSMDPTNEETKERLRCNLWLSFNDVRLLLEPSEANIQALIFLACHVEDFTSPSLCWMLMTIACRMLQALGINHRRFDPQVREGRSMTFWHLNLLDKGLALIFRRPPTFHRAMARDVPSPSLDQLLPFIPHRTSAEKPALFGAHYIHQMFSLSRIMADMWYLLYEDAAPSTESINSMNKELETWYLQAHKLLEAAALAEKPFLETKGAASIDIGLRSLEFTYEYLHILLYRSSNQKRTECINSSKRMLFMLGDIVSHSDEPYNGLVWHLLYCPFTPFLVLFREVLMQRSRSSREYREYCTALETLPAFLGKMRLQNRLAAKLERIAVALVRHAKSLIDPHGEHNNEAQEPSNPGLDTTLDPCLTAEDLSYLDGLLNQAQIDPDFGETGCELDDWLQIFS